MLVPLTRGKFAIIDAADAERVLAHNWVFGNNGYARRASRSSEPTATLMHRFITDAPDGTDIDHVNRNSLDNRRANLRSATKTQNTVNRGLQANNTSGYRGVSRQRAGRWRARIKIDGKERILGRFDSAEDAARAYDAAAIEIFGQFAELNFPE